jgi:hypothetical protein
MNGFSGDAIRRAIHGCKNAVNPNILSFILEIFPKEWILQDDELLTKSLDIFFSSEYFLFFLSNLFTYKAQDIKATY